MAPWASLAWAEGHFPRAASSPCLDGMAGSPKEACYYLQPVSILRQRAERTLPSVLFFSLASELYLPDFC